MPLKIPNDVVTELAKTLTAKHENSRARVKHEGPMQSVLTSGKTPPKVEGHRTEGADEASCEQQANFPRRGINPSWRREQSVEKRQRKWEGKTKRILRKGLSAVVGTRKKSLRSWEPKDGNGRERSTGGWGTANIQIAAGTVSYQSHRYQLLCISLLFRNSHKPCPSCGPLLSYSLYLFLRSCPASHPLPPPPLFVPLLTQRDVLLMKMKELLIFSLISHSSISCTRIRHPLPLPFVPPFRRPWSVAFLSQLFFFSPPLPLFSATFSATIPFGTILTDLFSPPSISSRSLPSIFLPFRLFPWPSFVLSLPPLLQAVILLSAQRSSLQGMRQRAMREINLDWWQACPGKLARGTREKGDSRPSRCTNRCNEHACSSLILNFIRSPVFKPLVIALLALRFKCIEARANCVIFKALFQLCALNAMRNYV